MHTCVTVVQVVVCKQGLRVCVNLLMALLNCWPQFLAGIADSKENAVCLKYFLEKIPTVSIPKNNSICLEKLTYSNILINSPWFSSDFERCAGKCFWCRFWHQQWLSTDIWRHLDWLGHGILDRLSGYPKHWPCHQRPSNNSGEQELYPERLEL